MGLVSEGGRTMGQVDGEEEESWGWCFRQCERVKQMNGEDISMG